MAFLYEKDSSYGIQETLERVKAQLNAAGFGVLWELNFKDKLKEKGLKYDYNFWILEVCNPPKALKVLESVQEAGYFLPCKVVVYETKESVRVGLPKPTELIELISGDEEVQTVAEQVEMILVNALNRAI